MQPIACSSPSKPFRPHGLALSLKDRNGMLTRGEEGNPCAGACAPRSPVRIQSAFWSNVEGRRLNVICTFDVRHLTFDRNPERAARVVPSLTFLEGRRRISLCAPRT